MSSQSDIENGMAQMNFEIIDNGVLNLPSSTPATYSFVENATIDLDALEEGFGSNDFVLMSTNSKIREDGQFYCHFDVITDHYKKVKVKTWNHTVCIFPHQDPPDTYEFARILHAIESAFGAELQHDPGDDDDE